MRALHLEAGCCEVRELERPRPRPGETRVRVHLAGVCATDLALRRGYMDFAGVPGHEFVGTAIDGPLAGRRVVGEINAGCGTCPRCRAGDPRHCAQRTVLGIAGRPGAFAEELLLPQANLLEVPEQVSDERAVFAEPLAAALAVREPLEQAERSGDLAGDDACLVIGDGRLGLLCASALALDTGRRVLLAGRHPERARVLPAGVRHLGQPLGPDAWKRERVGFVVEASGRPELLPLALGAVRPRGTLVLKTTAERPVELDLAPLVVDEIRLVGSRCGRFAEALEVLASGRLTPELLVEARYPLDRGEDALEHAARPGVLKVLLDITQG